MPPPDSAPALNPEPAKTPHDSRFPTGRHLCIGYIGLKTQEFSDRSVKAGNKQATSVGLAPPFATRTTGMGLRGPRGTLSVTLPRHGVRSVRIVHFRTNHEQGCSGHLNTRSAAGRSSPFGGGRTPEDVPGRNSCAFGTASPEGPVRHLIVAPAADTLNAYAAIVRGSGDCTRRARPRVRRDSPRFTGPDDTTQHTGGHFPKNRRIDPCQHLTGSAKRPLKTIIKTCPTACCGATRLRRDPGLGNPSLGGTSKHKASSYTEQVSASTSTPPTTRAWMTETKRVIGRGGSTVTTSTAQRSAHGLIGLLALRPKISVGTTNGFA